jgi:hypothetical protein
MVLPPAMETSRWRRGAVEGCEREGASANREGLRLRSNELGKGNAGEEWPGLLPETDANTMHRRLRATRTTRGAQGDIR